MDFTNVWPRHTVTWELGVSRRGPKSMTKTLNSPCGSQPPLGWLGVGRPQGIEKGDGGLKRFLTGLPGDPMKHSFETEKRET